MSLVALPQPWILGVILAVSDTRMEVGKLPVIGMYTNGDGIEAVVVMQNGTILRASQLQWDILFMSGPGEDPRKMARLAIEARGEAAGLELSIDDVDSDDLSVS